MTPQPPPSALDRRFAGVINSLFEAVGACVFNASLAGPLILLITRRLARTRARFYALFACYAAGKLPVSPRKPRAPLPAGTPTKAPPVDPLPRTFGWLRLLVPEAISGRSLLQHLVQTPEMVAFLAAASQAGHILRPHCRMLDIRPPPVLALPRRPAKPPPKPASAL